MLALISVLFLFIIAGCEPGNVRLVSHPGPPLYSRTYGRVELCMLDGSWSKICNERWDDVDAGVACRQLGFSQYGKHQF